MKLKTQKITLDELWPNGTYWLRTTNSPPSFYDNEVAAYFVINDYDNIVCVRNDGSILDGYDIDSECYLSMLCKI